MPPRVGGDSHTMTTDLAPTHAPLTDHFPRLESADDWQQWALDEEQVASFHRLGYLSGVQILNAAQLAILRSELEELTDPNHPGHGLYHEFHSNESPDPNLVLFHALGAWRISPAFHDLLWHPAVLVPAYQLLGGGVRFWHDQLFCKPAQHGGVVAWHQDYSYWTRTLPMQHLTCWIGLDDTDADNGCLHYVPGSHQWDLLPITGLAGDMHAIREVLTPEQTEQFESATPIPLKAGQAAFHHPLMVHGSYANTTDRPRRATVLNFCRDGTHSDSGDPLLQGVPVIPPGERLGGTFFPLLLADS